MNKEEFLLEIMTRREAEQYLGISPVAMQYHLRDNNLVPCKVFGEGNAKVQLFWREDLDELSNILKPKKRMMNNAKY